MIRLFKRDHAHKYSQTEGDLILRDLQKAFKFRYYLGEGISATNHKDNVPLRAKILLRDEGYILIAEDSPYWKTPWCLVRGGMLGAYSFPTKTTYLYSVKENILTEIRKGKINREWMPDHSLAHWRILDAYIEGL